MNFSKISSNYLALNFMVLLFTGVLFATDSDWSYDGLGSPEHWYELSNDHNACKEGRNQSPLNLSEEASSSLRQKFKTQYIESEVEVTNNTHTIQLNFEKENYAYLDEKKFKLLQIHFHADSEHMINDKHFPGEMHLVHKSDDEELLVVAVLMNVDMLNNKLISLSELPGFNQTVKATIYMNKLLPKDLSHFYYIGSLTTPPCTEGVNWVVMKHPITVPKSQLGKFKAYYSHNFRPVQEKFERTVYYAE